MASLLQQQKEKNSTNAFVKKKSHQEAPNKRTTQKLATDS